MTAFIIWPQKLVEHSIFECQRWQRLKGEHVHEMQIDVQFDIHFDFVWTQHYFIFFNFFATQNGTE